jgi:hypothetical protein
VTLANELKEKYGDGEFDINTGIFTPKNKYNRLKFFGYLLVYKPKKLIGE